ncbi:unnamed protein product [Lactuca virosa]|uniref:Uncharacterized protein n=1 Tax=Lactuca virosa TaxID=75947 RepID=A0AAU9PKA8_9ASTR|nr:unnamed protein product [Lactuca virosa]
MAGKSFFSKKNNVRKKIAILLHSSEPNVFITTHQHPENSENNFNHRSSNASLPSPVMSSCSSPVHFMSPINQMPSPYSKISLDTSSWQKWQRWYHLQHWLDWVFDT